MSLPKFEAASLDAAAMAMGSPAGWLAAAAFVASTASWDDAALRRHEGLVCAFEKSCGLLVKYGTLAADDAFVRRVRALAARLSHMKD